MKAKKREEGSLQKKEIVLAGRDHAVGTEEHGKHQRLVTQDTIVEKYVQQTAETKVSNAHHHALDSLRSMSSLYVFSNHCSHFFGPESAV